MKPSGSSLNITPAMTPIKVLQNDRATKQTNAQDTDIINLKPEKDAKKFKLIDERNWNIVSAEPPNETVYFTEGHSALSVVSVIGPMGVGKSSLLNALAGRKIFESHHKTFTGHHLTRGVDIYSTYHRILLDCQPFLAASVLEDFLTSRSSSQFKNNSLISNPSTSCFMISLQLATFLIATSDYVIIVLRWLADVHFLKLIASAIMLIGEDNLRAKFIVFSRDKDVHSVNFKTLMDRYVGLNRIYKLISDEWQLYSIVTPYSSEKLDLFHKDPSTFSAKNWLATCQKLWNSTIKGSSMFSDYANQVYNSNNCT